MTSAIDAEMLYAQLQVRVPEARSVLIASAGKGSEAEDVARGLASAAEAAGRQVQVLDLAQKSPGTSADKNAPRLYTVERARSELATAAGLIVVIGGEIPRDPNTYIFAAVADAVCLAVRRERTARVDLASARRAIQSAGGNLIGAVLLD